MALGRTIAGPLVGLNTGMSITILALSGRVVENFINMTNDDTDQSGNPYGQGFEGNMVTPYVILFSLLAGIAAMASNFTGWHHVRVWTTRSRPAAQGAAWTASMFLMLAVSAVFKEMSSPGGRGPNLRVLEACEIILTFSHFFYTMALYIDENPHHLTITSAR